MSKKERNKMWRDAHPEYHRIYLIKWRIEHPDYNRDYSKLWRARKKAKEGEEKKQENLTFFQKIKKFFGGA